jgi:prevent-host-death family protein
MLNTNHKGAIAEMKIATAAFELGIPVLRPLADHGRYDLAFEIGSRLLRVQCKWGRLEANPGVIKINLQSNRLNFTGAVRNSYTVDEIDLLAAYCGGLDRCYLLPSALVAGRREITLRLRPPRNGQRACLNHASQFEFPGAVAQWNERSAGSRKVVGSNPTSSTPATVDAIRIGSNEFRNRFGFYLERAAAGDEIHISRHGKPFARLLPPLPAQPTVMPA